MSRSSELRLRVISSVVLATVALLSAWVGGWFLALVWLGASIAVVSEWITITKVEPGRPVAIVAALGLAATQFSWVLAPRSFSLVALIAAALALAVMCRSIRDRGWAVLGLLYAAPIAVIPVHFRFENAAGIWPLLWMFGVVWSTDVAAYFVGRAVGGPKLWPAVSPNKTWSGFVGGLIGAVIAGTAVAAFGNSQVRFEIADAIAISGLSVLASVASQGGDLAESAMKRHFGVKDSGSLIPGHGGFMDRLDGFAAVAILLCLLIPLAKVSLWTVAP